MNDQVLIKYIQEVFGYYDRDRTGFLDINEIANFYNDLFARVNDPRRLTQQQAYDTFRAIDTNFDGRIERAELFNACKYMFAQQPYAGGYATYQQPVMQYQPQYIGHPQPQVIIITKKTTTTSTVNPYSQNPYR